MSAVLESTASRADVLVEISNTISSHPFGAGNFTSVCAVDHQRAGPRRRGRGLSSSGINPITTEENRTKHAELRTKPLPKARTNAGRLQHLSARRRHED